MTSSESLFASLRQRLELDEADRLSRRSIELSGVGASPRFRKLGNDELRATLCQLFVLEDRRAVVALLMEGALAGIYVADESALDEWHDEETDADETPKERITAFLKWYDFEEVAPNLDALFARMTIEEFIDERTPFIAELKSILAAEDGIETLLRVIRHIDTFYHRCVNRPYKWQQRHPSEHRRNRILLRRAVALSSVAACRVMEQNIEAAHPLHARRDVLRNVALAAQQYADSPAPESFTAVYEAGIQFYPLAPGPDCLRVSELGECDAPGSGCRSAIGFLFQVAHHVDVNALNRALLQALTPLWT